MDIWSPSAWKGVYPATILPLDAEWRIDEADLRRFLRQLMGQRGVAGLACNGHAGDAWSLTRAERRRVTEIHVEEARGQMPIICGVSGASTRDYIDAMADARDAGADAVLVAPPAIFNGISARGPAEAVAFFTELARAVKIPMVVFQHMIAWGNNYAPDTLARIAEIDAVVAVKASTGDYPLYERELVALRRAPRRISILASSDVLLFPYFALGHADGTLVSLASLAPREVVAFVEAFGRDDIAGARAIWERLFPVVTLFYRTPGYANSAFIKEALHIMGLLAAPCRMRAPHPDFTDAQRAGIRAVLAGAGLLDAARTKAA